MTAYDRKVSKLTVNSIWRVTTSDTVQTASGKDVLSGWQRGKIVSRGKDETVTVQYFDDKEDDEPITYDISAFLTSPDPTPCHVIELTVNIQSVVGHEQPVFVMKEREELLPLQKKKVSDPCKWSKNQCSFDEIWGGHIQSDGQNPCCSKV